MKTTQRQKIINYIREFGSITSYEAYIDLRCNAISYKDKRTERARI